MFYKGPIRNSTSTLQNKRLDNAVCVSHERTYNTRHIKYLSGSPVDASRLVCQIVASLTDQCGVILP